ncbi:MAG: sulfite exporter TauE/SafE family protein [Proteobacteria bacterium]|nr:sulfite exporter TauE/SafE family protein [Pseudomonadota bacterium]
MIALVTTLATVVGASLVGSLHCVGMCGGFVAFYAGSAAAGTTPWLAHAAYNGGRLMTYLLLGAAGGALGAAVDLAGAGFDLPRLAGAVAGVVMLLWGLAMLGTLLGARWPALGLARRLTARLQPLVRQLGQRSPVVRALLLGTLTTLLPCGWLYAFVVAAAGTGSAWRGAALMAAFWLGTVPALLGLGLGVRPLARRLGRVLPVLTALAVLALGALALAGRLHAPHARGAKMQREASCPCQRR